MGEFKYRAFISYSQDRRTAIELQRRLERFCLPKAEAIILGRGANAKPFPRIFNNEDE